MTTPGNPTGPGESRETPRGGRSFASEKEGRVSLARTRTEHFIHNQGKQLVENYRIDGGEDRLKEGYIAYIKTLSPDERTRLGIAEGADTEEAIKNMLQENGFFKNQLLYQINNNTLARKKVREKLSKGLIDTLSEEYPDLTDSNKDEIKTDLTRSNTSLATMKHLLENRHFRNKRYGHIIGQLRKKDLTEDMEKKTVIASDGTTKTLTGLDVIINTVRNLNSQGNSAIKDALLQICRLGEPDTTMESAFEALQTKGLSKSEEAFPLPAAFKVFFECSDDIVSKKNKDIIRKILIKECFSTIKIKEIANVSPSVAKKHIQSLTEFRTPDVREPSNPTNDAENEKNYGTKDIELAKIIKGDRENENKKYLEDASIPVSELDEKTQIRLLAYYGVGARTEKATTLWQGKPGSLRAQYKNHAEYVAAFREMYDIAPGDIDTKEKLQMELVKKLGGKIEGLDEHFKDGSIMEWHTKNAEGKEIIGYYQIDDVPTDDPMEDNLVCMRFLGNNGAPLSRTGITLAPYTPANFLEYLSGCASDGKIVFRDGTGFEEEMVEEFGKSGGEKGFHTDEKAYEELRKIPGYQEIGTLEALNTELDLLLHEGNKDVEPGDPAKRRVSEENRGMAFVLGNKNGSYDSMIVRNVYEADGDTPGEIELWDGWGTGKDSIIKISFSDFLALLKNKKEKGTTVYRQEKLTASNFTDIIQDEKKSINHHHGKHAHLEPIKGNDGEFELTVKRDGTLVKTPIIKIGPKKDIWVEKIVGDQAFIRRGTFTQADKEKGAAFSGTKTHAISLATLWSSMQSAPYKLTEIKGRDVPKPKVTEQKMSWLNIFKHAHSLGTILHGDLWKAPFKAWEEQHHKDHAYAGKITAALAMDKLGFGNWDFAQVVITDGNSTFQSYLGELVKRVEDNGSTNRKRQIAEWSKLHFPDPKFLAAMMASMQIFGHLYPGDGDNKGDPRGEEEFHHHHDAGRWFYYNSIKHAMPGKFEPPKFPDVPPISNTDKKEVELIHQMFYEFKHPIMADMGRRFQKYMNKGWDDNKDGGKDNLDQRASMDDKLFWMTGSMLGGSARHVEAIGSVEKWVGYSYPAEVTLKPFFMMMAGGVDREMLPKTAEECRKLFQDQGVHIPMFMFCQTKEDGDTYREAAVAMAYTISMDAGNDLKKLMDATKNGRLTGKTEKENWIKSFSRFWDDMSPDGSSNGANLMKKMSGARDPMIQMIGEEDNYIGDAIFQSVPTEKKPQFEEVKKRRGSLDKYLKRTRVALGSEDYSGIRKGTKDFYKGDCFRFRYEQGFPIWWNNIPDYLAANLEASFKAGTDGQAGDGIFNELRGFIIKIPSLAEKTVRDMGIDEESSEGKNLISKISKHLYARTTGNPHPKIGGTESKGSWSYLSANMTQGTNAKYYNVSAMVLGMGPKKPFRGTGDKENATYEKYDAIIAESIARTENLPFPEQIIEREKEWKKIQKIIEEGLDGGVKAIQNRFSAQTIGTLEKQQTDFESIARKVGGDTPTAPSQAPITPPQQSWDDDE